LSASESKRTVLRSQNVNDLFRTDISPTSKTFGLKVIKVIGIKGIKVLVGGFFFREQIVHSSKIQGLVFRFHIIIFENFNSKRNRRMHVYV